MESNDNLKAAYTADEIKKLGLEIDDDGDVFDPNDVGFYENAASIEEGHR